MIGIVIPAHNEERDIARCLKAAQAAASNPRLGGEPVLIVVVLDACTDATASIVRELGVVALDVQARSVGVARAAGAKAAIEAGARWLAFTDADTRVSSDWLAEQLAADADVVCGTVAVDDWSDHGDHAEFLKGHFSRTYFDFEGHSHIHGANLGISAAAYLCAGGFQPLACSEDVALVEALRTTGARIAWSSRPRVSTSARRTARAPGGFAHALVTAVANQLAVSPTLSVTASA